MCIRDRAKPWVAPDAIPYPFEFQLLEEDWEHFSVLMDEALLRVPSLAETGIRKFYNGPESFTPDNQFLLGRTPEVENAFIGAGFMLVGSGLFCAWSFAHGLFSLLALLAVAGGAVALVFVALAVAPFKRMRKLRAQLRQRGIDMDFDF